MKENSGIKYWVAYAFYLLMLATVGILGYVTFLEKFEN